jgi:16S rRNA (guanine527-N7)-methyltransferase
MLNAAHLSSLQVTEYKRLTEFISLILRWNARINLTAIRDENGILARHFVESIACAQALPAGIATLLDYGSGAGFPGIPIAICRPKISVTLAESQGKKAAFLKEAARVLELPLTVHSARAETLQHTFDCVTLRAVDRMSAAVRSVTRLVAPRGWMALMTTGIALPDLQAAAGPEFSWRNSIPLSGSDDRILALADRSSSSVRVGSGG